MSNPPSSSPLKAKLTIAAIVGLSAIAFAWAGGWLSPGRVSGGEMVDSLQNNTGKIYPGLRRAHTKGICVTGHFDANGSGSALSSATLFPAGTVQVIGRFNTGDSSPYASDAQTLFHGLGLIFFLPDGEQWRMAMDHTPIFPVSNAADFVALQVATTPDPTTKKPDKQRISTYLAAHPETKAFLDYESNTPVPSSFANGTYYSINAFRFTNASGQTRLVRWQFEPETPFTALDKSKLSSLPPNFLFDDIRNRLSEGPLRWHLILVLANPGDKTDNATIAWTGPHARVDAGTLVLTGSASEQEGNCRDYNFDPLILPKGVAKSDDPLLAARSAAYSSSFRRRAKEGPPTVDTLSLNEKNGGTK
ncbi:catalase family peroxidase [Paraburkholderia pallida]|uniref:Catalase-related peroxidase n=1 Tax=Paraburkholderia pallida TaxID=2547399 RepID=A0A4P7D8K1_9BURK|nr:catalase family peroxidase [Paraburkholderia pallida]QBR03747.1 catalase family peroxidase [Paraburkholderia pallida]